MTPEELDAIERDYNAYGYAYVGSSIPDLIAALREAWGALDTARRGWKETVEQRDAKWWSCPDCGFTFDAHHTDVINGVDTGEHSCPLCEENRLQASLDKVRAVIAPRTAHDCPSCGVLAREVEAAIEEECRP